MRQVNKINNTHCKISKSYKVVENSHTIVIQQRSTAQTSRTIYRMRNINARKQDDKVGREKDKPENEERAQTQNQPLNFKIKGE